MEPYSLPLECVPDLQLSSDEQNEVMPRDFQGPCIKQVASTWVPRAPLPSLVLEEASHHVARTLLSPFERALPPETSTKANLLAPVKPSGGCRPGWHLALHLRVEPWSQQLGRGWQSWHVYPCGHGHVLACRGPSVSRCVSLEKEEVTACQCC